MQKGDRVTFTTHYVIDKGYKLIEVSAIEGTYEGQYQYVGSSHKSESYPVGYDLVRTDEGGLYMVPIGHLNS